VPRQFLALLLSLFTSFVDGCSQTFKIPQAPVYILLSYLLAKRRTRRMYACQGKSGPGSRWSLFAI
jgi:hypothetical protein